MISKDKLEILKQVKKNSFRTILFITGLCIILVSALAYLVRYQNIEYVNTHFEGVSASSTNRIISRLKSDIEEINDVRDFFNASEEVKENEFSRYTSRLISNFHYLVLSYADFTPLNELGNDVPKEITGKKLQVMRTTKDSYFLIKNIEPISKYLHLINWDISSDSLIDLSIQKIRKDSCAIISDALPNYFKDSSTNIRIIFTPVYKSINNRPKTLEGILVAFYPFDSIIQAEAFKEREKGMNFSLHEVMKDSTLKSVYNLPAKLVCNYHSDFLNLSYEKYFSIENRKLLLTVKPNNIFVSQYYSNAYLLVLVFGFLLTAAFSVFSYYYLSGRRFNRIVKQLDFEAHQKNIRTIKEFLNSSVDMNSLKDFNGKFIAFNKYFVEFVTGGKLTELIPPDQLEMNTEIESLLNQQDEAIYSANEIVQYEIKYLDRNYEIRKFPVEVDKDQVYLGCVIRDITEQKKSIEEILKYSQRLEESEKAKDKFFSIIAHDLRSPFLGILGYLELLKDDYDYISSEEKKKMISTLFTASNNIYNLLDNLLEWSRTQTDRMPFKPVVFSITETLDKNLGVLQSVANRKSISLINKISQDILVFADLNMVRTILLNLISNAVKFTEPGGSIIIRALLQGNNDDGSSMVTICVEDSGVGIPEALIKKLFRLDEKVVTPGTKAEKGTGLGLILCKEFVERNGGKIWVESTPGIGSIFCFSLRTSTEKEAIFR
jgi:signal transduction histidine kinase/CHASE1-domain containing sensor protein